MSLSRERIVSVLVSEGGRMTKAKLVGSFQGALECDDRDEKARNRELFKSLVNSVAYVRRGDDGVSYVLLRKAYQTGTQQKEEQPTTVRCAGRKQEKSLHTGEQGAPETASCSGQEQPEIGNTKRHTGQEQFLQTGEQEQGQLESVVEAERLPGEEHCQQAGGHEQSPSAGQEQTCESHHNVPETPLDTKCHAEQKQKGEQLDERQPETKNCSGQGQENNPIKTRADLRNCAKLKQEYSLQKGPPETAVNANRRSGHEAVQKEQGKRCTGEDEEAGLESGDQGQGPAEQEQVHTEHLSPFKLALQRSKCSDVRIKPTLNVEVTPKPYALPLRMPPAKRTKVPRPKEDPEPPKADPFQSKGKTTSVVPLEPSEHEWLVKCASGHWSQVYGLLLRDHQLAEKQDFMSGFTALHWAAKCGNGDMLVKILNTSRQGGTGVDVNARSHGGYTPLHMAALHRQDYVMTMLVSEYGADTTIRDNCGKRAYHYLHRDASRSVRELLGEPKSQPSPERLEDADTFPDLPKGLHSISRLFQPHLSAQRRKQKQRPAFYSLGDEPQDQRQDSPFRQRLTSDAFALM